MYNYIILNNLFQKIMIITMESNSKDPNRFTSHQQESSSRSSSLYCFLFTISHNIKISALDQGLFGCKG
jgi:hypothetical protein